VNTKKLLNAVEDGTQVAIERLSPYVEQALRDSGEFADHTYSRVRPAIKDATIRGARLAADTFERVHPAIDEAIDKVYPAVNSTVKRVRPAVDDVLERIPPSVDFAREVVQEELLPNLAEQLRHLAGQPLAHELKVAAASAALAKQLDKASGKKRSGWKTFGKIVLAGAILGGVAVAVKKLLADPSSGWETYAPRDSAYVANPVDDDDDELDSDTEITEEVPTADQAAEEPAEDADLFGDTPYGEGSYIGDEPPADFLIKGNDRSKKYHVPGSASYERTSAEVWFVSEEAAQAAGFVKAQR
jgi:hypothetical protein